MLIEATWVVFFILAKIYC